MDLSRWGLQKFTRLSDRYRNFQQFLGEILEGERSLLQPDEGASEESASFEAPFEVRSDFERLLETPIPSRGLQALRTEQIFERLAPYFEAGFLLKAAPETGTRLLSMFMFGRVFVPPETEGTLINLALPELAPSQVAKGRVKPLMRAFKLDAVRTLHDASAFLLCPKPGVAIILICDRPHPWQVSAIEKAHWAVNELFARSHAQNHARNRKVSTKKGLFR